MKEMFEDQTQQQKYKATKVRTSCSSIPSVDVVDALVDRQNAVVGCILNTLHAATVATAVHSARVLRFSCEKRIYWLESKSSGGVRE
jgi:hypothetical protein